MSDVTAHVSDACSIIFLTHVEYTCPWVISTTDHGDWLEEGEVGRIAQHTHGLQCLTAASSQPPPPTSGENVNKVTVLRTLG